MRTLANLVVVSLFSAALVLAQDKSWFDGNTGAPPSAVVKAPALKGAPKPEPPVPADLKSASGRWSNAVQAGRIAPAGPEETFSIAVIGDAEPGRFPWERVFSPGKDAFARQMKAIQGMSPRAVVQLGDFVSKGTADNYRAHVAFLDQQVTVPLLTVIGNHDRSAANSAGTETLFNAVVGPGDFYTDVGAWRLILLDSSARRVAPGQLKWLEEALKAGRRSIIFTHVPPSFLKGVLAVPEPVQTEGYNPFEGYFEEGSGEFGQLMERYKVARVYMGHLHAFSHARYHGVAYVLTGGGGSPLYPMPHPYPSTKFAHFILTELGPKGVVRETVYKLDGGTIPLEP